MKVNVEKTEMMKISRQPSSEQIMRDHKQPGNVEYYNYFGSMITSGVKCIREIKACIALATAAFETKQSELEFKEEIIKVLYLGHNFAWC